RRVGHGYQRGFELVEGGGAVSQCPRVALIGVRSLVRRLDGGLDPGLRGLGTTTGPRALQHGQRPTTTITDLDVAFGQLLRDLDTALPSGRVTGLDLAHKLGQRHGYPKKFVRLSENVRTPHHRPARSFRFSTNNSAISCAKSHGSSSPILARLGFAATATVYSSANPATTWQFMPSAVIWKATAGNPWIGGSSSHSSDSG